jgi:hypothetical protein
MLATYLRRLIRTAFRGIFGTASDWAWFVGPPLLYLAVRNGALKLSQTDGLLGGWVVGLASFGVALAGLALWRLSSASFRIFVEDQAEIARLRPETDTLLLRQVSALEEQNRLTRWANDPLRLSLRRNADQMARMQDRRKDD